MWLRYVVVELCEKWLKMVLLPYYHRETYDVIPMWNYLIGYNLHPATRDNHIFYLGQSCVWAWCRLYTCQLKINQSPFSRKPKRWWQCLSGDWWVFHFIALFIFCWFFLFHKFILLWFFFSFLIRNSNVYIFFEHIDWYF